MSEEKKRPIKSTIIDILRFAEEVAWEATAEAAERFSLPYKMAFSLLKYVERYAFKYSMNMAHKKGWMRVLINAVAAEADRVAFLMRKALVEVNKEERERTWKEIEKKLEIIWDIEREAALKATQR